MEESSIFGISVRAIIAMFTVGTGLGFLYAIAFTIADADLLLVIVTAVVGFIGLAIGYYLGQKNPGTSA